MVTATHHNVNLEFTTSCEWRFRVEGTPAKQDVLAIAKGFYEKLLAQGLSFPGDPFVVRGKVINYVRAAGQPRDIYRILCDLEKAHNSR